MQKLNPVRCVFGQPSKVVSFAPGQYLFVQIDSPRQIVWPPADPFTTRVGGPAKILSQCTRLPTFEL